MATTARGAKTENLTFRVTPEDKFLVETAAAMSGSDVTGFVLSPAIDRAREIIEREQVTVLTEASRSLFQKLVLEPPVPSDRFIRNLLDDRHQIIG